MPELDTSNLMEVQDVEFWSLSLFCQQIDNWCNNIHISFFVCAVKNMILEPAEVYMHTDRWQIKKKPEPLAPTGGGCGGSVMPLGTGSWHQQSEG